MYTKIKKHFAIFLGVLLISTSTGAARAVSPSFGAPFTVSAVDTVAGYSTALKTSRGAPNESIIFRVQNPLGTVVELDAKTNEIGVAATDLYGFHTQYAGKYLASAYYRDYASEQPTLTSFSVFPDTVSPSGSRVLANTGSVPADGTSAALITARIQDKNGNPIPNHQLTAVSSRPEDTLTEAFANTGTNQNGEKVFELTSATPGISHITILDRDTGITVSERAQVVFFEADTPATPSSSGGMFGANIFGGEDSTSSPNQTSGPVAGFRLQFSDGSGQENIAVIGKDQNYFTVTAIDAEGNTVRNYTGSILISVDDAGAKLPNDGQYTFKPEDEGSFEFALAFQFSQIGKQTIRVYAYDATAGKVLKNIRGELEINVQQSAGEIPSPPSTSEIEIKTPLSGNKYASADITVTGKAGANSDFSVFLDSVETATISTDSDGLFFTTLSNVGDGAHQIYIKAKAGNRETSEIISFSVDTKPSSLSDVRVFPEGAVASGSSVTITVIAEAGLNTVRIALDGREYALGENLSRAGNYEGSVTVPEAPGLYPIDVVLEDKLGNESKFLSQAQLEVSAKATALESAPQNLTATPGEESVELKWDALENAAIYVVFGGKSAFSLSELKSVPANQTAVLVSNLEGGAEYFFSVKAMDTEGNLSPESTPISARPLFAGEGSSSAERLVATPLESGVILSWQAATTPADQYLIRYGVRSQQYLESVTVSGTHQEATVHDLINGLPYYFTVIALKNGQIADANYGEISATPRFGGLHGAAAEPPLALGRVPLNASNGPAEALLVGISLLMAGVFLMIRRHWRQPSHS